MSCEFVGSQLRLFQPTLNAGEKSAWHIFVQSSKKVKSFLFKLIIFVFILSTTNIVFGRSANNVFPKDVPKNIQAFVVKSCEKNLPFVEVDVKIQESPISESNQASVSELTGIARKLKNTHALNRFILGLTTIELSWETKVGVKSYEFSNTYVRCARPELSVNLTVNYHKVQVAHELAPATCEYNFIREHEYKHVSINEDNIRAYARTLSEKFQTTFHNQIYYGTSDEISNTIHNEFQNQWLPFIGTLTKKMEEEGNARHELIDSPEEYEKVRSACSGNIERILKSSINNAH